MDQTLRNYVARKVVEDLRQGKGLDEDLLLEVRVFPLIDDIRSLIRPDDLQFVRGLLNSPEITRFRFGLSLVRKIQHLAGVREVLENLWATSPDAKIREAVIWALTQYPDTPRSKHREFFRFFLDNPKEFYDELVTWFGGTDKIISGSQARLSDPGFHAKRWMYLWCLAFAPERDEARSIVAKYTDDPDDLTREVAQQAMQRLSS
jgi:hypothetical protein